MYKQYVVDYFKDLRFYQWLLLRVSYEAFIYIHDLPNVPPNNAAVAQGVLPCPNRLHYSDPWFKYHANEFGVNYISVLHTVLYPSYDMSLTIVLTQLPRIFKLTNRYPDSKVHGANMGPTWILSVPDGPHACWTHEPCYQGSQFSTHNMNSKYVISLAPLMDTLGCFTCMKYA